MSYDLTVYDPDTDFDRWYTDTIGNDVATQMVAGQSVLEVGCATGRMTARFVERKAQVMAVTLNGDMLGRALARELPGVSWLRADIMDCHFGVAYDHIVCCSVLHEVEEPAALLERLREWSKAETRLHVSVPNMESLHRQIIESEASRERSERAQRFGVLHDFDVDGLKRMLELTGWSSDNVRGRMLKPYPNHAMEQVDPDALQWLARYTGPAGAMLLARAEPA